jgi:hypothetical protein
MNEDRRPRIAERDGGGGADSGGGTGDEGGTSPEGPESGGVFWSWRDGLLEWQFCWNDVEGAVWCGSPARCR